MALATAAIAALSAFAHAPQTASATTPQATLSTSHDPFGTFGLQAHGLTVHFYGAASDPDTAHSIKLVYYLNDRPRETALANLKPGHIYSKRWTMSHAGTYRVTVMALNYGPGNARTMLGRKDFRLIDPATRNPRGNASFQLSGKTLRVTGAVLDPDKTEAGLRVRTYNNGYLIGSTPSNGSNHRYAMTVRLHDGVNNISVKAVNIGLGTHNVIVGRAAFQIQPPWASRYGGNQGIAAKMLASYGWGANQMPPLVNLWNRESNWRTWATNPAGGAYGIPQALPASKLASAGADWRTSASTQIRWGLSYIAGVYGSPGAAWAHEVSQGWY